MKFYKSFQFDQATFKVLETALKNNLVSNVLIFGSTVFFMGIRSEKWFTAPIGHEIQLDMIHQMTWANPRVTLRDSHPSRPQPRFHDIEAYLCQNCRKLLLFTLVAFLLGALYYWEYMREGSKKDPKGHSFKQNSTNRFILEPENC